MRGRPHHDQHTPSIFSYPQIKFFSSQVFPFVLTNSRLQISFKDFSLFCSSLQFSEALCQNFYFLTKIPSFIVRDTLKLRKNNITHSGSSWPQFKWFLGWLVEINGHYSLKSKKILDVILG